MVDLGPKLPRGKVPHAANSRNWGKVPKRAELYPSEGPCQAVSISLNTNGSLQTEERQMSLEHRPVGLGYLVSGDWTLFW